MINLTENEKRALAAINELELTDLIEKALQNEQIGDLRRLPFAECGVYVSRELHKLENCLRKLREAKSAKKREDKRYDAWKAGSDLSFAVSSMKKRMEIEEREGQLFYIDDHIIWPRHFTRNLQVRVSFRWRVSIESSWNHGNITFHHEVRPQYSYTSPQPKKKPSASRQAQDLKNELSRTWEHLMNLSLYSVREFFRAGGDGSAIPLSFQAIPDRHTQGLNNFSLNFWTKENSQP